MPLQKLEFRPGLNREGTDYANEGGWYDGDKIRFRSGFPEKIGGWSRLSNLQFLGLARAMWNWINLTGENYLGVGTNVKYYIEQGGAYYDITPVFATSTNLGAAAGPFTASTGSASLVITDATYTPSVGDYIIISGAVTLGGNITATVLNQEYEVAVVGPTANQYTIQAKDPVTGLPVLANASDTGKGGATVVVKYLLPTGLNVSVVGTGWGTGPWGRGPWGSAYSSGLTSQLRLWSNDNFGADLLIAPRGGAIYYWDDTGGLTTRAVSLTSLANSTTAVTYAATFGLGSATVTVPSSTGITVGSIIAGIGITAGTTVTVISGNTLTISAVSTLASSGSYTFSYAGAYVPNNTFQVVASSIQKFVIAMGANSYVSGDPATPFNPMLVRWSDQLNPYQWVPEVTNQAGEFALTNGSFIMGARATRQEILVWTDSALYSMQYLGAPYVWGFSILMDNISVMSPNAMITVNNVTYWMGADKFYMYSGRVETLPCALRQYVFNDINKNQAFQVFAGSNEGYNEVWWFYCSTNSTAVDKYVIYNYVDRVWYYGSMARTAWLDSGIRQYPMAADYNSRILYHESSVDDNAGDSSLPISAYVQSSDFDIGDGHNFGFVWRILPDINFNGSNVNQPSVTMTIRPRVNSGTPYSTADNPRVTSSDNYGTSQVYNIQEFTGQVYTRLRGRQLAFRIESDSLGVAWQLGMPRIDIRPDGRR